MYLLTILLLGSLCPFGWYMLVTRKGRKPFDNTPGEDADALRAVDYCGIVAVDPSDFEPARFSDLTITKFTTSERN